ncbi:CU044_5270 family protein [Actinomadura sp. HBU206391]|uniref:CU044_5270 family protein n=1 Tax=Actinomadura sp. HBU206391 TaxID=2731692 RepID=UPI00164F0CCD|nr:CU044_5270 family protein [Actinomadura sp. HBU206391]MBC6456392.1 CU044_5270 family protein [Actinomadura sp. HBU206391]
MDDLQMLATALDAPEMPREAVDRGRHRLQNRMRGPVPKRRTGWLTAGLSLTAAAAAAAVVVTSGTTAPPATPNSPPATAQPSARQILLVAATTAERTPEGSGTYWYVKTTSTGGRADKPFQSESWTRRDGQTWFRGEKSQGKVVKLALPTPFRLGGPDVSFARLQKLPTKPDELKAWIADALKRSDVRTSAGRPDAAVQRQLVLDGLISLVSQLPAPPKVRAAAFRAIASYPIVKSLGVVKGGQGLLIPSHQGQQARLVVDTATSRVHDTNFYVTADGSQAWLPSDRSATVVAEWTNLLPD